MTDDPSAAANAATAAATALTLKPIPFRKDFSLQALTQLYEAKDSKGRMLSEMFITLPDREDFPDYYEEIINPMDLKTIKAKVKAGKYATMQDFVHDVNLVFQNAQQYNLPESQIFADSVSLLKLFNTKLSNDPELAELSTEGTHEHRPEDKLLKLRLKTGYTLIEKVIVNGVEYEIGDYVYVDDMDGNTKRKNILQIYHIFQHPSHPTSIHGCRYYYPDQTFHLSNRKFYVNEVFKTVVFQEYNLQNIHGKCVVLFIRDMERGYPKGFLPQDIYVCENRYTEHSKSFQVIKQWKTCIPHSIQNKVEPTGLRQPLELYSTPKKLTKTIPSVFANQTPKANVPSSPSLSTPTISKSSPKIIIDKEGNVTAEKSKTLLKIPNPTEKHAATSTGAEERSPKKIKMANIQHRNSIDSTNGGDMAVDSSSASGGTVEGERKEVRTKADTWSLHDWLELFKLIEKHGIGKWNNIAQDLITTLPHKKAINPSALREKTKRITKGFSIPCPTPQEIYKAMELKIEDKKVIPWIYEVRAKTGPNWFEQSNISPTGELPPPSEATLKKLTPAVQSLRHLDETQKAVDKIIVEEQNLPKGYVKELNQFDDHILWFTTPPTAAIELPTPPQHSRTYMQFKQSKFWEEMQKQQQEQDVKFANQVKSSWSNLLISSLDALTDSLTNDTAILRRHQ